MRRQGYVPTKGIIVVEQAWVGDNILMDGNSPHALGRIDSDVIRYGVMRMRQRSGPSTI